MRNSIWACIRRSSGMFVGRLLSCSILSDIRAATLLLNIKFFMFYWWKYSFYHVLPKACLYLFSRSCNINNGSNPTGFAILVTLLALAPDWGCCCCCCGVWQPGLGAPTGPITFGPGICGPAVVTGPWDGSMGRWPIPGGGGAPPIQIRLKSGSFYPTFVNTTIHSSHFTHYIIYKHHNLSVSIISIYYN